MKYFRLLLLIPVLFTLFVIPVKAVQLSPSSGSIPTGVTQTVNISASPPAAGSSTVQVRLNFSGPGQVTGYVAPQSSQYITLFGACPGSTGFNATSVCADVSKSGSNLNPGDSLGSFTFTTNAPGTINITKSNNNGYVVGSGSSSSVQPDTSGGATYTVINGLTGKLPNTAINDNYIFIVIGIFFLVLGASLYYNKSNKKI